jgi:three-Cys-motif partner protein
MLEEYLKAYVKVLKNQRFQCVYIDAFAGTGYREMNSPSLEEGFFAKELTESEPQEFFDGSARIALRTKPSFSKYIFIERSSKRFEELLKLKTEFVSLADRIVFDKNDCNSVLQDLCRGWDSFRMRGVLFLDPFGMQVEWSTLEAVARTQAIDVWILFPLGVNAFVGHLALAIGMNVSTGHPQSRASSTLRRGW